MFSQLQESTWVPLRMNDCADSMHWQPCVSTPPNADTQCSINSTCMSVSDHVCVCFGECLELLGSWGNALCQWGSSQVYCRSTATHVCTNMLFSVQWIIITNISHAFNFVSLPDNLVQIIGWSWRFSQSVCHLFVALMASIVELCGVWLLSPDLSNLVMNTIFIVAIVNHVQKTKFEFSFKCENLQWCEFVCSSVGCGSWTLVWSRTLKSS